MKKKAVNALLSSLLVLPIIFQGEAASAAAPVNVMVDGKAQTYTQAPVIKGDITLVPLRSIFESLGAEVKWDAKTKKVTASKGNDIIELSIGSKTALKNSLPITLYHEAEVINGHTMVPLRFVSEALGAKVEWNANQKTVTVTTKNETPNSQVKGVSYQQAYEQALKTSYKIQTANANIERQDEVREKAADNVKFTPSGTGSGAADAAARGAFTALVQADIGTQSAKKQLEMEKESLAYQVKTAYNAILQAQQVKSLAEVALKHAEAQAILVNHKFTEGQASQFEVSQAETNVKEAKSKLDAAIKNVDDAYQKFNLLTGLPQKEHPALTDVPVFVPLKDNDVDTHVSRVLSNSTAVWLVEQKVNIAKLNLDLYTFNNPANPDTYKAKEIDVQKEELNVASTKQQLEQATKTIYYNIKKLEDVYAQLQASLSKAEENLKVTKARYDAGMAIGADLLTAQLAVEQLKQQMFDTVAQLDNLKMAYEKPWVMQSAPAQS